MAVTIEDLRKEDLFLSWEGATVIFSKVIANNGVDADLKLWIQARKYAARIGLSFTFVQGKGTIYSPALDYIRICSEIESDKKHEEWWKMTMRAVLFTMVCTFGTNDYFGHSVYDKYIVDEIDFKTMLDSVNPDFSQFPSDQSIYDHVENVLFEIKEDYHKAHFYRYNVFDENIIIEDISESDENADGMNANENINTKTLSEEVNVEDFFVAPENDWANKVFTDPNYIYKPLGTIMEKYFVDDKNTRNISLARIYRVLTDFSQFKNDYNYIGFVRALNVWNLLGEKSDNELRNLSSGMNSYFRPRKHRGKEREILEPDYHNWNSEELNRHKQTCIDIEKVLKDKANVTYRYQTDNT